MVVVCLGKELAADAWLEEWNRLRKRGDVPNKIEVIELRTDPKYGGFIAHQPADARVTVERTEAGKIAHHIHDFISPTIIERLKQQANLLDPADRRLARNGGQRDDRRRVRRAGVQRRPWPTCRRARPTWWRASTSWMHLTGGTTVAVKVTDMLGEEVLKLIAFSMGDNEV